jgi:hypothetical protein
VNRRAFITLLGGAAGWPLMSKTWSIFIDGLKELGWTEGKNIAFEPRYAENDLARLPELAAELVRLNVDVILAFGTLAPLAAKRASATIPICDGERRRSTGERPRCQLGAAGWQRDRNEPHGSGPGGQAT